MQKKIWVQSKGKSANGIHRAWAQRGGLRKKKSPWLSLSIAYAKQHLGQKSPVQANVSHSGNPTPPRRTGRDCFNLLGKAKSPAVLQQGSMLLWCCSCCGTAPATAPAPTQPTALGIWLQQRSCCKETRDGLLYFTYSCSAHNDSASPWLPNAACYSSENQGDISHLVTPGQGHFGLPTSGSAARTILSLAMMGPFLSSVVLRAAAKSSCPWHGDT